MMIFVIIVHVLICAGLIGIVLIQRGRGSGLVESFAGVESMFGTKTDAFLTRATTVLSTMFFITCLTLAVLSVKQSKSLMKSIPIATGEASATAPTQDSAAVSQTAPQVPAQETKVQ